VAAASGALPIYNTTDTYGTTKGTGTRTDSNSSSIVLAIPMDGINNGTTFTDESATIKGSGSAVTLTRTNATTSTSQSKFYGSSGNFDGTSTAKYLSFNPGTIMNFGTGDFTIEAWVQMTSRTTGFNQFVLDTSGGTHIAFFQGLSWGYEKPTVEIGSNTFTTTNAVVQYGVWQHWAVTRSGTTLLLFVDGVQQGSFTNSTNVTAQTTAYVGNTPAIGSASYNTNGYISDLRIYKGVAKYTGNFNPPSSTQNATIAAGNDSLVDTPTNYGTDTGVGGEVRGNYCTWNPLKKSSFDTLLNGNLDALCQGSANATFIYGTWGLSSGKWYWEVTINNVYSNFYPGMGICTDLNRQTDLSAGSSADYYYIPSGNKVNALTQSAYGASFAGGDIMGVALDMDAGTITFYKNGVSQGQAFSGIIGTAVPIVLGGINVTIAANFGQRPFAYQTPGTNRPSADHKALCTQNLTDPVVAQPSTVFDVLLYTGNSSTQTITGLNFNPDLVFIKSRNQAAAPTWIDSVRGGTLGLFSSTTNPDTNIAGITAFNANGFTLGGDNDGYTNYTGRTYVAWCWDAGSSTVPNTQGSITSQVRANTSAGFSIVTFTAQSSGNATIGHGLGVEPYFIIFKSRAQTYNWGVYHKNLTSNAYYLILNSTAGQDNTSNAWNSTTPTSTVFTLGSTFAGAGNSVAYCFAPVAGYSSFGSYTGNGSTDGPFVFTGGFKPRWLMIKRSDSAGSFIIWDTSRTPYNLAEYALEANSANAESSGWHIDLLSNGFKSRNTGTQYNQNGGTYIYAAFAESPFKYARAR
jgi:hypothetical protein